MGRRRAAPAVGLAVAALLAPSGCGAAEDQAAEDLERELEEAIGPDGVEVDVDPDSDVITIETDEGTFVRGTDQGRPEWLSEELPLPEDLEITVSSRIGDIDRIQGTTTVDANDLRTLYGQAATEAGYTIADGEPIAGEEIILLAYRPDGTPVDVRLDGDAFDLFVGRFWESPPD